MMGDRRVDLFRRANGFHHAGIHARSGPTDGGERNEYHTLRNRLNRSTFYAKMGAEGGEQARRSHAHA